jgi:3-oxoacyl-[acyl-carrier-protein] synthase-3
MIRSHILGTGFHVPARVVRNEELAAVLDTSDEWIRTRTGIEERHWISDGETGLDLSEAAARKAIASAGLEPTDIDAIVFATSTPDHNAPGGGVFLQHRLGLGPIPAIDVRTQCSGFIYSLAVADAWVRVGLYQRILVVGCEIQSTGMNMSDEGRHVSVIFADGAGAAVVGPSPNGERGFLAFDLHGDGSFARELWADAPCSYRHPRISHEDIDQGRQWLQMNGREVFRHAVARMPESAGAALAKAGLGFGDVNLLIPHQANLRISEMIQKGLRLRDDQIYNNIQRYGNTTAATIPIALDECRALGRLKEGDIVVLTAFGSGFLWGSCVVRW